MAKGSSKYLFLSCLLSILTICSSETLVGFSYDARKSNTISQSLETKSFLELNKVSPSQIRIIVSDHTVLDTLSNASLSVDLYLSETYLETLKNHNPSSISWLKTHLITFLPKVKIKSIIVNGNRNNLPGQKLLSTLKSIHSIINGIGLKSQVTVSVSFSLSFLENLNRKQEKYLHQILNFVNKTKSFVVVEARIDGALSMGDRFVESAIKKAHAIPFRNVPIVLTINSPAVPSAVEVSQFCHKISRSLESSSQTKANVIELFAILSPVNEFERKELKREEEQMFHSSHRELLLEKTQHDMIVPPSTNFPTTPITNPTTAPVTIPPENNPAPTIVTVPSTNPGPFPYTTPLPAPYNDPVNSPVPITNPVTTPVTVPVGAQPVTNPVTTYPAPTGGVPVTTPVTTPVVAPPATTNAPAVPGQGWCVAKAGAVETALQSALDYACGIGGADCATIQQSGSCYNPNSLQNHASYAFNSYYQKNPVQSSCDFGGTAMITNINPSTGSCIYPTSSSSSLSPSTAIPTPTPTTTIPTPTPTTASTGAAVPGTGSPPTVLNASIPGLGTTITNPASGTTTVFDSPPGAANSTSISTNLQPFISSIILVSSIIVGTFALDMWRLET